MNYLHSTNNQENNKTELHETASKQLDQERHSVLLAEDIQTSGKSSSAGQRRLRTETTTNPLRISATEHPAGDLQMVYDMYAKKYETAPGNDKHKYDNYSITDYFASIGDIQSMTVLIKYGKNIKEKILPPHHSSWLTPIAHAAYACKYDMVRFLVENECTMEAEEWIVFVYAGHFVGNQHNIEMSEEKIRTLEYLLDHGTPINNKKNGMLDRLMWFAPKNATEQHYKDRVIKMLLDRGAKLDS